MQVYKSYNFRDKDPVIDMLRTIKDDAGLKHSDIERNSGVSSSTLHNWFEGTTRRPQFATIMAVARSLGYDVQIVSDSGRKRFTLPKRSTG